MTTESGRGEDAELTRRQALGASALGITTFALPSAAAASSFWQINTAESASFPTEDETWTLYRLGGTGAATRTTTVGDQAIVQLTGTDTETTGAAINSRTFAASSGLDVRFTMAQWGTETGADGLAFFLVDAATDVSIPGAEGGGLAYSGSGWNGSRFTTRGGIRGGLVGVGFDNFGNFGAADFGPKEAAATYSSYDGAFVAHPWLSVRGREDTNYSLHLTVDRDDEGYQYWADTTFSGGSTRVRVTVSSAGQVTVYAGPTATAFTSLPQIGQVTISGLFSGVTNVRFGFSAATGGQTNNHAVYDDVTVTSFP